MKITYFKAKNFIGIYAGTGRNEIEIDFEKNSMNEIILLLGDNGSGKSTLASIANPFRETFDCRKNIILPEKDGYKEIHLLDGQDRYIIKHHYGKTSAKNKSYISKNTVELNENGNIGSFTDTLMEKFNLTKDYFTVGKVGSNVEGFIGLSTANRKAYINKFIPNIDEYLEAYEVVNEKYKQYNKDMKSLKSSLDKLNEDELILNKTQVETNIKVITNDIKNKEKEYNSSEIRIVNIRESIKDVPSNIRELYMDSKKKYEQEKLKYNGYLAKYPKLSSYDMSSIANKINDNKIMMNNLKNDLENINSSLSSTDNGITSNELEKVRFDHLKNEIFEDFIKPSEIKVEIFNSNSQLSQENENLQANIVKLKEFNSLDYAINGDYGIAYNEYKNFFNTINSIKNSVMCETIDNTDLYSRKKYVAEHLKLSNENVELENKLKEVNMKLFYIENNYNKYKSIYDKKPVDCKIVTCSFIKDAEDFIKNEYSQLESLIEISSNLNERINTNNKLIESLDESLIYIDDTNKYIISNISSYIYLQSTIDFSDMNKVISHCNNLEDRIREELISIKNYKTITDTIDRLNMDIERNNSLLTINEQKEKRISEYEGNICALDNHNVELQEKLDEYNKLKDEKAHEIQVKKNTNKLFDIFSELINTFQELSKEYEVYEEIYNNSLEKLEEIDNLETAMLVIKRNISDFESQSATLNKDVEKIKNELFLFETYSTKLKEIETIMQELETVKEALDPKKGIPLIFMNNYLNIIGASTNELLDKAYNGDFKIAFDVTPKDFMINVYKSDGTKLNDISEASQGEVSLTTIALSLAMMDNLLKECKYNVLYLDEVDATLSSSNRRIFLELLKIQMSKSIEQCFVISHNDEFYSHPIDLILFKGNKIDKDDTELMDNKSIVWELR